MNKDIIKELLYMLIAITLGIISVKFIIWLLPVILIAIVSYYVYKSIKKNRNSSNKKTTKKKTIKIIEMVEDDN